MSRNHGPARFRGKDGKLTEIENPNWRANVNKKRANKKLAKKSKQKNR